jgi:outer membrane lipoprotein-sorting protein
MKSFLKKVVLISLASTLYASTQNAMAATTHTAATPQQAQLKILQDYLNGIRTLRANFSQQDTNGTMSSGKMYLKRLGSESFGKLLLEYAPPSNNRIIANGEILRIVDGQTNDVSEYSIDNTPASFLLRHKIDFFNDLDVKNMETKGNKIYLTVTRSGEDGVTLTLIFVTTPILRLQEWSVLDAQGNTTHVVLKKVEIGVPLDERLFRF